MNEKYQDAIAELHSVNDWVRWGAAQFQLADLYYGHGTDNPWDEALQIVLWTLKTPFERYETYLACRLTVEERKTVAENLRRRIEEKLPVPYITGEAFFCGLKFHVNSSVLVPRSPLAELIERGFEPWLAAPPAHILDLCTGSGCIGIACAAYFEHSFVDLSDISSEAIACARENIAAYDIDDRVSAVESDLFSNLGGRRYDLIVSNPPYVDAEDMASLPDEYRNEPTLALASGDDGLDFTRRLLKEAVNYLSPQGTLLVEVGNSWLALEEAFPMVPFTWLEFEHGGHGVFMLTAEELQNYAAEFK